MENTDIKRKYIAHSSNRSNIYRYYFSIIDSTKFVCRKFLLNTLNITEKLLRCTRYNKVNLFTSKTDHKGKKPNLMML